MYYVEKMQCLCDLNENYQERRKEQLAETEIRMLGAED